MGDPWGPHEAPMGGVTSKRDVRMVLVFNVSEQHFFENEKSVFCVVCYCKVSSGPREIYLKTGSVVSFAPVHKIRLQKI